MKTSGLRFNFFRLFFYIFFHFYTLGNFVSSLHIDEDCMAQIGEHKFDFSRDQAWVNATLSDLSVAFSLCRTSDKQNKCGPYSLCATHKIDNLTQIPYTSNIESFTYEDKVLQVNYKSSEKSCNSEFFSVSLKIVCGTNCEEPVLVNTDPCNLEIMWLCHHACIYHEEVSSNCMLNTGSQRYDLRALNGAELQAKINDSVAHLDLCGNLKNLDCPTNTAFALVKNSNCNSLSYSSDKKFILSSTKGLRMVFNQTFTKKQIIISLKCTEDIHPVFNFIKEEFGNFYFTLNTILACDSPSSPCKIKVDENRLIDLSPLRKKFDNWSIHKNKNTLIFNICSGLNYQNGFLCSGGKIGACLKKNDGSLINYGDKFDFSKRENKISFSIYNGEKCGEKQYSINITLIPSLDEKPPEIMKDELCNIRINWHTKFSIPVEYFQGSKCQITPKGDDQDLRYLQELKFDELFETDARLDLDDGSNFRINLCAPLRERCGKDENSSVCYTDKEGNEFAVGFRSEPFSSDRSVQFILEGKGCDQNNILSETHFYVSCSYDKNEISLITQEGCKFYFIWRTDKACLFEKNEQECAINDGNESYDLSPLSDTGDNYKLEIDHNTTLFFSICHNLVPEHQLICPSTSSMCLKIRKNVDHEYKHIGGQRNFTRVEKNHLKIELKNYECSTPTVIDFFCSSEMHSTPSFQQISNCSFHIELHTIYACTKNILSKSSSCSGTDPRSEETHSLSTFMSKQYEIDGYYISICEPLKKSNCHPNSTVCPKNPPYKSHGDFNTEIKVLENSIMLNYTTSVIYFICGKDVLPEKIHEVNGINYLYWKTSKACLRKPICGEMKSLKFKLVEVIAIGGDSVVFSSCEQLDIPGKVKSLSSCPGGSAACLIGNSTVKSLGYPLLEPFETDNSIELLYPQGDICNREKGLRYSTKISFICSRNKKEKPFFKKLTHDCQYQFVWPTSSVCQSEPVTVDCSSHLIQKIYEHNKHLIFGDVYINLCDKNNTFCDGFVCFKNENRWETYSDLRYHDYFISENRFLINFVSKNNDCSARLMIQCGEKERSEITWMKPNCGFEVIWYSPIPCGKSESFHNETLENKSNIWKHILTFAVITIGFFIMIKSRSFLYNLFIEISSCNRCRRNQVDERTLLQHQSEDYQVFNLSEVRPNDDFGADHWSWQV